MSAPFVPTKTLYFFDCQFEGPKWRSASGIIISFWMDHFPANFKKPTSLIRLIPWYTMVYHVIPDYSIYCFFPWLNHVKIPVSKGEVHMALMMFASASSSPCSSSTSAIWWCQLLEGTGKVFGMKLETYPGWWLGHPSEKYERQLG